MTGQPPNLPRPKKGSNIALIQGLNPGLIIRLFGDSRVPWFLKLLPVAGILYLFAPDWIPCIADDALVIWLLNTIFVSAAPRDVVDEIEHGRPNPTPSADEEEVVEAEVRDVSN